MGHGITVTCRCGYFDHFQLGVGIACSDLRSILSYDLIRGKRMLAEITELLDNHDVMDTDYAHVLMRCDKCMTLYTRFAVQITYESGQLYETEYKCPHCRRALRPVDDEAIGDFPCPECGEKILQVATSLMWD